MNTSIAAFAPFSTQISPMDTEIAVGLDSSAPVGPEYLQDVLSLLPADDRDYINAHADVSAAEFAAPDDGEIGFMQWWFLPRRER